MLEQLLAGGKTGKYFPDSGPGNKLLLTGTKEYGFFGEVTEAEMGLNDEFNRILAKTSAYAISVGAVKNTWFKFVLKEKYLFFPLIPIAGVISFKELYEMRAVTDANDSDKYPTDISTNQPLYEQNLHISNTSKELFKVRLFDSFPDTPHAPTASNDISPANNSEIALMFAVLMKAAEYPDAIGVSKFSYHNWGEFSTINGNNGYSNFFTMDISPGSSPKLGYIAATTRKLSWLTPPSTSAAWRPLLQYIPAPDRAGLLLSPDNLVVSNEDMPQQVTPSSASDVAIYAIAPMGGIVTDENEVAGLIATTDIGQYLYEIDGVTQSEYSGYFTA